MKGFRSCRVQLDLQAVGFLSANDAKRAAGSAGSVLFQDLLFLFLEACENMLLGSKECKAPHDGLGCRFPNPRESSRTNARPGCFSTCETFSRWNGLASILGLAGTQETSIDRQRASLPTWLEAFRRSSDARIPRFDRGAPGLVPR